jgi:hypothetical protein
VALIACGEVLGCARLSVLRQVVCGGGGFDFIRLHVSQGLVFWSLPLGLVFDLGSPSATSSYFFKFVFVLT